MSPISSLRMRHSPAAQHHRGSEHRIVILIRSLLAFESALYAAVTPVLPHYAHQLHASKPAIGLLAAAYPAGMLPGSVLGGIVANRYGVRRATVTGLLMFTVSVVAFGFATELVSLDALRFVQGGACGFVWGGGLAWVIAVAPRKRRGEVLGAVMAAAIVGTLAGPIVGTLAVAIGTQPVFLFIGAVSVALAVWTLDHPEPPRATEPSTSLPLRALVGNPRVRLGFWLILLEAATLGALGTLLPLRLSRFGASGVLIGLTFLASSLMAALLARPIGRVVDRRGARLPLIIGLSGTAVLLATLALPRSVAGLAVLGVFTLGGPLSAYTIPGMSVMTDATERMGVALVFASMMLNIAWALGETIGAPAAATVSQATSDAVPFTLLAAIMLVTLVPVLRARLTRAQTSGVISSDEPVPEPVPAGSR